VKLTPIAITSMTSVIPAATMPVLDGLEATLHVVMRGDAFVARPPDALGARDRAQLVVFAYQAGLVLLRVSGTGAGVSPPPFG
jgi:hypothetical protein